MSQLWPEPSSLNVISRTAYLCFMAQGLGAETVAHQSCKVVLTAEAGDAEAGDAEDGDAEDGDIPYVHADHLQRGADPTWPKLRQDKIMPCRLALSSSSLMCMTSCFATAGRPDACSARTHRCWHCR